MPLGDDIRHHLRNGLDPRRDVLIVNPADFLRIHRMIPLDEVGSRFSPVGAIEVVCDAQVPEGQVRVFRRSRLGLLQSPANFVWSHANAGPAGGTLSHPEKPKSLWDFLEDTDE